MPRSRSKLAGPAWALAAVAALATGCAGGKEVELPPQSLNSLEPENPETNDSPAPSAPTTSTPAPDVSAPEAPVPEAAAVEERPNVIVIDSGDGDEASSRSLVEAARAERERRATASGPAHVITDGNLSEYATGELTFADGPARSAESPAGASAADPPGDAPAGDGRDEAYWRGRGREIRQAWRDAVDRVELLESRIAELRERFYAEDDPYYRDSQIKPAWDHALDQLEETKRNATLRQEELAYFLEEGRLAGALPGWLREGLELEPLPEREAPGAIHEPNEPVVVEDDGELGGGD